MDLGAIEQLESEFPWERGEEHGRGNGQKRRMKEIQEKGLFQGINHTDGDIKLEEIEQVVIFLCCRQGIEISRRRGSSHRMSKGMTASLDLVHSIILTWCICAYGSIKNKFNPDPTGRKRQVFPKLLQYRIETEIKAF